MNVNAVSRALVGAALAAVSAHTWAATSTPSAVFFGPSAYLSAADIPVGFYGSGAPTLLDNLEDGSLDNSLLGSGGGSVLSAGFGGSRDSVDADDELINGTCGPQTAGRCVSWFNGNGAAGATFTFVGSGPLPTAFGLVWTDGGGGGTTTFSAQGGDGQSLGSFTATGFADGSFSATTGEDRFFGLQFAGGIRAITISNNAGGIEVDHIQYGQIAAVPEPATWALWLGGAGLLAWRRRVAR